MSIAEYIQAEADTFAEQCLGSTLSPARNEDYNTHYPDTAAGKKLDYRQEEKEEEYQYSSRDQDW